MKQKEVKAKIKERIARRIISGTRENAGVKSGVVYVVLAFSLCVIGVHNFYAGFVKRGVVQLLLTLVSPMFMFLPLLLAGCWGIIEMLFQNKDAKGRNFTGNTGVIWGLRLIGLGILVYSLMTTELIL